MSFIDMEFQCGSLPRAKLAKPKVNKPTAIITTNTPRFKITSNPRVDTQPTSTKHIKMSAPTEAVVAPAIEPASVAVESKPVSSEAVPDTTPTTVVPEKVEESQAPAPAASPSTPLSKLFAELPAIISEAGYQEMWGVELSNESSVPTSIVLEKFLRANTKDVAKAKAQLIEALKWRKGMDPVKLLKENEFDAGRFGGLGYVTVYHNKERCKEIVTWNIYGGVKDNKDTFGNVEEYDS
jgi:hypothetical protein